MKLIRCIFGPMGTRQFSKIGYIIMITIISMLSILIWVSTDLGDIVEVMVAILLPFIINVFFRSVYRRHFHKKRGK